MTRVAGYRVNYYRNHEHYEACKKQEDSPIILHEPLPFGNKLSSGRLSLSLTAIASFEFSLSVKHPSYNKLDLLVGMVEVINLLDGTIEFLGRILTNSTSMSSSGLFMVSYLSESVLGYLHDSAQNFKKYKNDGARRYLGDVINYHNLQVEPHKRFWVRRVTVDSGSDIPYRYTGYDSTFETIKTYMLERMGGHLVLEILDSGFYLDWLAEVGTLVDAPLQLGKNIKSAKREINPEGLITRLVPVGADKEDAEVREEETGQFITRERVTIESVNNGLRYLDDERLIAEFGIIQKSVDWTEISNASILKSRGLQYLENQRVALASWNLETVELYLIDERYPKYIVGNRYVVDNPFLAGAETLQVIEKTVDILQPQLVNLTVGSSSQSLSAYQLQQAEARKSMEKVLANEMAARRLLEQQLAKAQQELLDAQEELQRQIISTGKLTTREALSANLEHYQTLLKTEKENLRQLESKDKTDELIQLQLSILNSRIGGYELLISDIQTRLSNLEKEEKNGKV